MDDNKIVSLYWDRNEQAITESEEKYGEYCYRIAFYILNEKNDADESVNDIWQAACNSMPSYRPSVLKNFLGKLTRRISINKRNNNNAQKRGRGQLYLSTGALPKDYWNENNEFAEISEYLETHETSNYYIPDEVLIKKKNGEVRSIDIARYLGITKPSVTYTTKRLKEKGYITMDKDNYITITEKGLEIAEKIYTRHHTLTMLFIRLGVPDDIAEEDACKIEHDISPETFDALCRHLETYEKKQ